MTNFNRTTIIALKTQLDQVGYANDEQFLGSTVFEHRRQDLFNDLNSVGYSGSLSHEGEYFPEAGAVYWIYDSNMISRNQAVQMTRDWVAKTAIED